MTQDTKTQVNALIAAQEKNAPDSAARRQRITLLCEREPLPVAQAVLRMLLYARMKNEVLGRYNAADNLIELTDAAYDALSARQ